MMITELLPLDVAFDGIGNEKNFCSFDTSKSEPNNAITLSVYASFRIFVIFNVYHSTEQILTQRYVSIRDMSVI
jgi:hypothetical protein